MSDIFISYRRDGGDDLACFLRDRLTAMGYDVFLDIESLKSGDYLEALRTEIENCTHFLPILSRGALDSCGDENDVFRMELEWAKKYDKNIVPILKTNFKFPDTLPESLEYLRRCNGLEVAHQHDKSFFEILQSQRLNSASISNSVQPIREKPEILDEKMLKQGRRHTNNSAGYYEAMQLAVQGDANAQYELGQMYYRHYVFHNKNACYWLKLAASKGHARAMYLLGKCCYYGLGIRKSYGQAVWWYKKSLERDENLTEAMWSLGDCYRKGCGVGYDDLCGAAYYLRAMNAGDPVGRDRYIDLLRRAARNQKKHEQVEKHENPAVRIIAAVWATVYWIFVTCLISRIPSYEFLKEHGHCLDNISEEEMADYWVDKQLRLLKNGWVKIIVGFCLMILGLPIAALLEPWISNDFISGLCECVTLGPGVLIAYGMSSVNADEDVDEGKRAPWYLLHAAFYMTLYGIKLFANLGLDFMMSAVVVWILLFGTCKMINENRS